MQAVSQGNTIVIQRTHALEYRMPLKRPFGTARYVTTATTNFIVQVHSEHGGRRLTGVGEAQPRNKLTGDINNKAAWSFFIEAVESVQGRELQVGSTEEALASVRTVMEDLHGLAAQRSRAVNRERPFRGSLLGIEIALLDVVAQALDVSIAAVLGGEKREDVVVTASTLSTENSTQDLQAKVTKQASRYPMNRVKGRGDQQKDLLALKTIHAANVDAGTPKPIWMDINEGLDPAGAEAFIADLAQGIAAGDLPETVTLEQPVPKADGDHLPALQKAADELTAKAGSGDIRIMPDESMWDAQDLEHLQSLGGCRSINIKTAKAGGLIASLDTAERAVELNPDVYVYIGGMIGTSDITTWAIHQLVLALPRIDYLTAVPPGNVEERIAAPLSRMRKGTSVHRASAQSGLGASLAYDKIAPYIVHHAWFPAPVSSPLLEGVNRYPVAHLRGFREKQIDNHVLEKEALGLGLSTFRTSPADFVAQDAADHRMGFSWTKSTQSSSLAANVTGDKQTTRDLLRGAGVPVPQGRRFDTADKDSAVQFAEELGYPVVFKPLRGTGGQGVIPGIQNAEELRWAFDRVEGTALGRAGVVIEQHLEGREFRIFALRDKVLSVVERRPGMVQGDGQLSIAELMLQKHLARMQNPHLRSRRISFAEKAELQLQRQGYDMNTILEPGEKATYTLSPSFHQGGESAEMLAEIHPSILDAAAASVRAIPGLAYAGVDFIIPEPGTPISEQRAGILELNAHPAQSSHEFPMLGKKSRVSREIVRFVGEGSGMALPQESAETLNLVVRVRAEITRSADALEWFKENAEQRELAGWVKRAGRGIIRAEVSGTLDEASSLTSALIRGGTGIRVASVETTHSDLTHTGEFEVQS